MKEDQFTPICEASITEIGLLSAAHCVAIIRAFVIVENVKPALEFAGEIMFLDIVEAKLGKTIDQDFASIHLPFKPFDYFEIADNCQPQYIVDKISHRGESGRCLLDDEGKICGVLSKCQKGKTIYSGLRVL